MFEYSFNMKNLNLLVLFCLFSFNQILGQNKVPVILDADTGNEVDDLYAVTRALMEPGWQLLALNAVHWQTSHWAIPNTMENSHRLNGVLKGYLKSDVKTLRGGAMRMYDWGDQAQHSAAAYEIIKQAKALPEDKKLTVIALGALTNVASAIYISPEITPRLKLYWLGSTYDFEHEIFGTTDFNCVMDIQALHIILKSKVEMHIMPVSTAAKMTFDFDETQQQLKDIHPLGDFLVDRWYNHLDESRYERIIWDLALVEAILHPGLATEVIIKTSKDYGNRTLYIYKDIQSDKMRNEFFEVFRANFTE